MIEIIPAMDIIGGRCVRLRQGAFDQKTVYDSDPLVLAQRFEQAGIRRLHLVDLDGARAGAPVHLELLQRLAENTSLRIDFSGGLRRDEDADAAFEAGASFLGIGSLAVKDPEKLDAWVRRYGGARIIVGADVLDGHLAIQGWLEQTAIALDTFLETLGGLGITQVFCTDIAQDGMLAGPAFELYQGILQRFPELQLIGSGGVRDLQDIQALEALGCSGVIVGKAIYEGRIALSDLTSTTPVQ